MIHFFYEDTDFLIKNGQKYINKIELLINKEAKKLGDINCILCSDSYLLEINKKHLNHDYYTDIITFNYNNNEYMSGDLYISIDRIRENAKELAIQFEKELERVLIHGVLHLVGYNDKTPQEQAIMREKEDFYLILQA